MPFLIFIIFGAVVGWLASMILKTDSQQGFWGDLLLGILGSMFGGWIMNAFGQSGVTGLNLYSFLVATFGAVLLVLIGRKVRDMMK